MKLQQLPIFLKDISPGKYILFEDKLEKWRNEQNLPLSIQIEPKNLKPIKESSCVAPNTTDLQTVLLNTKNGQMLLDYYNKFKYFKEQQRNLLINVIGNYMYENNVNFTLKESYKMENEIIQKFPTEKIVSVLIVYIILEFKRKIYSYKKLFYLGIL